MPRQVDLTRTFQKVANQSYRYQFTASAPQQMVAEIFVLHRGVFNPITGETSDIFDRVASPLDLATLPAGDPLSGQYDFRVATSAVTFATQDEAEIHWTDLVADVNALVQALNLADTVTTPETITIT